MTKKKTFGNAAFYIGNTLIALIFVSPLIWMISSSLKPEAQIFKGLNSLSTFIPTEASLNNYVEVFQRINMWKFIGNSLFYVLVIILLDLLVNSICGYALAKFEFKGKNLLLTLVISLMVFPAEAIMLPMYREMADLGWINSWASLIVPFVAKCFSIYMFRQFCIGYIQVISNGSLMPDQELLETMKKCGVRVRLSDYTHVLSYEKKLAEVKRCLEAHEIPYDMSVYKQWFDLGTNTCPIPAYSDSPESTASHMRLCATGCHQLNDRRFFFCGQGFARPKKGFCSLEEGDYIDLSKCTGTVEEKEMLLRFCMGYPPKGYISVCRTCYGMGSDNDRIVSVAEQM